MPNSQATGFNLFKLIPIAVAVVLGFIVLMESLATVDANELMVVQAPWSGTLAVYTDPGTRFVWFGKVTRYPRRIQYSFLVPKKGQQNVTDESIKTRFNDGANAHVSGVVSWEMPLDAQRVIRLHKEFNSFEAIDQQLIRPMLEKVVYTVGPTMSSTESSAERRPEIPQYIDDQLVNGPYLTHTKTVKQKDALTGADKDVAIVEIVMDASGQPQRSAISQITDHGIKLFPVTINDIVYDGIVEDQIKQRQKATTEVQIAQANARKAQQDAITIEAQGQAAAATAKWAQETINAKEIAEADKNKQVASLKAQQAQSYKAEQVLIGEGDAERKRLVMAADGALDQKLKIYAEVNGYYAQAIAKYTGNWVPGVVMGGNGTASNGANALIDLLTVKTAKDLGLDMGVGGSGGTTKK